MEVCEKCVLSTTRGCRVCLCSAVYVYTREETPTPCIGAAITLHSHSEIAFVIRPNKIRLQVLQGRLSDFLISNVLERGWRKESWEYTELGVFPSDEVKDGSKSRPFHVKLIQVGMNSFEWSSPGS